MANATTMSDSDVAKMAGGAAPSHAHGMWTVEMVRGIALTLLGLAIVIWPQATLVAFVYIIAGFAIALGVVDIIRGIFTIGHNWAWVGSLLIGILAIVVGVLVFRYPVFSLMTFVYALGFYFVLSGILALFTPKDEVGTRTLPVLYGILTIILGILLLANPVLGFAFYWVAGIFALIAGPVDIAMAFHIRNREKAIEQQMAEMRPVHV